MRRRPAGLAPVLVIVVTMLFPPVGVETQQAAKVTRIGYLSLNPPDARGGSFHGHPNR